MATFNPLNTKIFLSSPPPSRSTKTITNTCSVHLPKCLNIHFNELRPRCRSLRVRASSAAAAKALGEVEVDFEEEEWGRWKEKCKEMRGLVEVLDCLEREAIMGVDEGKEPSDYSRRAHIFDKSSRVFQALKDDSSLSASNHDD